MLKRSKKFFFAGIVVIAGCMGMAKAASDNISADFAQNKGVIKYRGSGFLHSLSATTPNANYVETIKPKLYRGSQNGVDAVYNRCVAMGCSVQVVMSDSWRGGDPASNNWSTYRTFVETMVNKYKGKRVQFDVWNEANSSSFYNFSTSFYTTYNEACKVIRATDPTATIVGPSLEGYYANNYQVEAFLQNCKANNTLPDVVSWHFFNDAGDGLGITAQVNALKAFLARENITTIKRIQLNEILNYIGEPAPAIIEIAQIERNDIEGACHACWQDGSTSNCSNNSLDGLLAPDGSLRSEWHAYKAYADMTGNLVATTAGTQSDGLMTYDVANREIRGLFARNRNGSGDIDVTLNNLSSTGIFASSGAMTVTAKRLLQSDNSGPVALFTRTVQYSNNRAVINIPSVSAKMVFMFTCIPEGNDEIAPVLNSASSSAANLVKVNFSEWMDPTSAANKANYALNNGITISSAALNSDNVSVNLTTSAMTNRTNYTVTVNSVKDIAGNTITANSSASFVCAIDTTKPVLASVSSVENDLIHVYVFFSEVMDSVSVKTLTNYSMNNGRSITAISFGEDRMSAVLTVSTMTQGQSYTLSVNNVKDLYNNTITANSNGTFVAAVPPSALVRINCGGAAVDTFSADTLYAGGHVISKTDAVAISGVADAGPMAIYQINRFGMPEFSYTIGNLSPNASYRVRLHNAEIWFPDVNRRKFNVSINGTAVLTDYDIVAEAGGPFKAVVRTFNTTANASGTIVINFTQGLIDNPQIAAIEVLAGSGPTNSIYRGVPTVKFTSVNQRKVAIYSIRGELIDVVRVDANVTLKSAIHSLPAGMYVVKEVTDNKFVSQRFVVAR